METLPSKDTTALANSLFLERGFLLQAVLDQNERHKSVYADKVCALTKGNIGFTDMNLKLELAYQKLTNLDIAKLASEDGQYIYAMNHPDTQYSTYDVLEGDKIIPIKSLTELISICDSIATDQKSIIRIL